MKNNPLKPDDYIQQLYASPKLIHIQKKKWHKKYGNKTRHILRVLVSSHP